MLSLRNKKRFKPRPKSRIFVPLKGSFKFSDEQPRSIYMVVPPRTNKLTMLT